MIHNSVNMKFVIISCQETWSDLCAPYHINLNKIWFFYNYHRSSNKSNKILINNGDKFQAYYSQFNRTDFPNNFKYKVYLIVVTIDYYRNTYYIRPSKLILLKLMRLELCKFQHARDWIISQTRSIIFSKTTMRSGLASRIGRAKILTKPVTFRPTSTTTMWAPFRPFSLSPISAIDFAMLLSRRWLSFAVW